MTQAVERVRTRALWAALLFVPLSFVDRADASPRCPEGMWPSGGSCCSVGTEYIAAKNQCLPVRAERRCVAGHLDDCVTAGRELEQRGATGASYAAELYRYACEEGYAPACRGLGSLYHRGLGLDRDEARARVLYEESCDGGDAAACTLLGKVLLQANQGARAFELFTQACHRGDADACGYYGEHLSLDPEQAENSATYLGRACSGGVGSACRSLLQIERRSQTVAPARVRELLDRACRGKDAEGCTLLGDAFRDGLIAPQSGVQAAARYRTACDGGHVLGCMRLAELTAEGDGVRRDLTRAAELYGRACGAGVALACERVTSLRIERERERAQSAHRDP